MYVQELKLYKTTLQILKYAAIKILTTAIYTLFVYL